MLCNSGRWLVPTLKCVSEFDYNNCYKCDGGLSFVYLVAGLYEPGPGLFIRDFLAKSSLFGVIPYYKRKVISV